MTRARQALIGLGLAEAAWGLATGCLVALLVPRAALSPWEACAWAVLVPAVVLTPCAGLLAARRLLAGCAGVCLGVAVLAAWLPAAWPWWLPLLATAAAVAAPVRDDLLLAAARRARVPLARAVSLSQSSALLAWAGGLFLGQMWRGPAGPSAFPFLAPAGLYLAVLLVIAAGPRGPAPASAGGGFFRTGGRLFHDPDTRELLLASALFVALFVLVAAALRSAGGGSAGAGPLTSLVWFVAGAALGSLTAALSWHPSRVLGLVPLGVTGLGAAAVWGSVGPGVPGFWLLVGAFGGLTGAALRAGYLAQAPQDTPAAAAAWRNLASAALAAGGLGLLVGLEYLCVLAGAQGRVRFMALLLAAALPAAWWLFFRQFAEGAAALLLGPCYRIRTHGPGLASFPEQGPLLVLANHAAWFDPLWLCKVLPRRMTPLMISIFYDKPVLHWLMARVVRAIRVLDSPYRREAPELDEAVAVLDRGGCVLIFPEGVLRRKDEVPLRPFGQGVWRILRERPATPVVVCWIEGGWGSLTSHCNGPPLTSKPLDWLRPIDIAVEPPRVLDPDLLADQHATRRYLFQACLDARRHLEPAAPAPASLTPEPVAGPR